MESLFQLEFLQKRSIILYMSRQNYFKGNFKLLISKTLIVIKCLKISFSINIPDKPLDCIPILLLFFFSTITKYTSYTVRAGQFRVLILLFLICKLYMFLCRVCLGIRLTKMVGFHHFTIFFWLSSSLFTTFNEI